MARRHTRSFVRGPRAATDWSASVSQTDVTGLPASTVVLDQVITPIVGGETLLRTRGIFAYAGDQTGVTENPMGAVGIGVVSAQAAGVGITAVPHPVVDAAWGGWLWHHYFAIRTQVATAVGYSQSLETIVIDSKGMRKVGEDMRLVVVVENAAAFGMIYTIFFRLLSKVH